MKRTTILLIFMGLTLLVMHRQKFNHIEIIHHQANNTIAVLESDSPYNINQDSYRIGQYVSNPSELGLVDRISRKKINSFVWNYYNNLKIEVTFVDLGYASTVLCTLFTEKTGSISYEEKIGFTLQEDINQMNMSLDINKKFFKLTLRQARITDEQGHRFIKSTFNITLDREANDVFALNLTHYMRVEQCITALRSKVVSHKCYGGFGSGNVLMKQFRKDISQQFNSVFMPIQNHTRCAFDGFRGSGFVWKWVWALAHGFSKPEFYANGQHITKERWIGLNFGHINNKSEDFIFLNGKIYPVQGIKYTFDERKIAPEEIIFTGKNPKFYAAFKVMNNDHKREDLGVLKNQMIKLEGYWSGWIVDPEDNVKVEFYQIAGLVESADSIF